jgi:nitrite reductase (NADH) small subunit
MTLLNDIQVWTIACAYDHLIPGRGVGVLLDDGSQAALFRLDDGSVHAVGNVDPFSGAAVISRGIVGDRGGRATVQSPILKQAFALDDGSCLDDPRISVPCTRCASRRIAISRSRGSLPSRCPRQGSAALSVRSRQRARPPTSSAAARIAGRSA